MPGINTREFNGTLRQWIISVGECELPTRYVPANGEFHCPATVVDHY